MFILETLLASLTRVHVGGISQGVVSFRASSLSSSPLFDCFGKSGLELMRKELESTVFRFSHRHKFTQSGPPTDAVLGQSIRAGNGRVNLVKRNRLWFHALFRAPRWHTGGLKSPSLSLRLFSPLVCFAQSFCPLCTGSSLSASLQCLQRRGCNDQTLSLMLAQWMPSLINISRVLHEMLWIMAEPHIHTELLRGHRRRLLLVLQRVENVCSSAFRWKFLWFSLHFLAAMVLKNFSRALLLPQVPCTRAPAEHYMFSHLLSLSPSRTAVVLSPSRWAH